MDLIDYLENDLLPQALLYGMTEDQFWYKETSFFENFKRHYFEHLDLVAWKNAQYNMIAMGTVIDKAVNGKKAKSEYPNMPMSLSGEQVVDKGEKEKEYRKMTQQWM